MSSEYILEELQEKTRLKFKGSHAKAALDLLLYILQRIPLEVKDKEEYQPYLAQTKDLVPEQDTSILALAMLEDVDYLVTGDKADFLENKKVRTLTQVKLKSPREMLDILLEKSGD